MLLQNLLTPPYKRGRLGKELLLESVAGSDCLMATHRQIYESPKGHLEIQDFGDLQQKRAVANTLGNRLLGFRSVHSGLPAIVKKIVMNRK